MTTASDWTCACRAVNARASVWCEACGTERPDRARAKAAPPKLPEGHALWVPPSYPEPTAEDDAQIRAELARLKAAAWWRQTDGHGRAPLPAVDPAIRARVEGPQPVGAILPARWRR